MSSEPSPTRENPMSQHDPRLATLILDALGRLYPETGPDPIAAGTIAQTIWDNGWRWITAQRVEAAMNKVGNLGVEAYEPTISELTEALLAGRPMTSPDPSDAAETEPPEWMAGHEGLAERMFEVWHLAGRPDPFDGDMEAWRGFALGVQANVAVHSAKPLAGEDGAWRQFIAGREDANDPTKNHYEWFFTTGDPTEAEFDRWLDDTEAKMRGALGDIFVNDAARVMLTLIQRLRSALPSTPVRPDLTAAAIIENCINIVQQSLDTVRSEAGDLPSGKVGMAAREHVIALLTGYRDREASNGR